MKRSYILLALVLSIIPLSVVSAAPGVAPLLLNTPLPTLTQISTPVPPVALGTAMSNECSGVPAGYGTLTPSSSWLAVCGQCLPSLPTSTPYLSPTPPVTSTPCLGCTPIPSATPSPVVPTATLTGYPYSLELLDDVCAEGLQCTRYDAYTWGFLITDPDSWYKDSFYQWFYIPGNPDTNVTLYTRALSDHGFTWDYWRDAPAPWGSAAIFYGRPPSPGFDFGGGETCYGGGWTCGSYQPFDLTATQTFNPSSIIDGRFQSGVSRNFLNTPGHVDFTNWVFYVSLQPINSIPSTPSPSGASYCSAITTASNQVSPWRFTFGNVISQSCFHTPTFDLRASFQSVLDILPLGELVTGVISDWLMPILPEFTIETIMVCIRQVDYSLYLFNRRVPIGEFIALVIFLSALRFWLPGLSTGVFTPPSDKEIAAEYDRKYGKPQ